MEENKTYKKGDFIKIKKDLPISTREFAETAPGWTPAMNCLLDQWVQIDDITDFDDDIIRIYSKEADKRFYINKSYINKKANPKYAEKALRKINKGDWVIYYESDSDKEIATVGKVTDISISGIDSFYDIDGFDGYKNAYFFDGDLEFLEAVRNNEI